MIINSVEKMRKINQEAGFCYFAEPTMSAHGSRILTPVLPVPGGAVFVQSTKARVEDPRMYTVSYLDEATGDVENLSAFAEYRSSTGAKARAKREQIRIRGERGEVN